MRIAEKKISEYPPFIRFIFWAQKKKYGASLLPSKIWGRSPRLMYGLQVFYRCVDRKSSPLEPGLRSLTNILVSQINHCDFCMDISSSLLQKQGISIEKIEQLSRYKDSELFSEKEKKALEYAEAITKYDQPVSDDLFSSLKQYFSEDEIVELTGLIGYQNLSSKFNAALDVPNQGFCLRNTKE